MNTCPSAYLASDLYRELRAWVEEGYPLEVCGLLSGVRRGDRVEVRRVVRGRNLCEADPEHSYRLDPRDWINADRDARARGEEVVGFWHSHPDDPARPSRRDEELAWGGYSYLIASVTEDGASDTRCWMATSRGFLEQRLVVEPAVAWTGERT